MTIARQSNRQGYGYAISAPGTKDLVDIIIYDGSVEETEKISTVLHEIGHVLLGHTRNNKTPVEYAELEASTFSATIFAMMLWDDWNKSAANTEKQATTIKSIV